MTADDTALVQTLRREADAHDARARQPENITIALRLAADRIEALGGSCGD